jgi:hypothetical protein
MASNKNQHFVPRCYLRPFTKDGADAAINLYNIDRQKFIPLAPLKHQCSGDYFYGKDDDLEKAIQSVESAYGAALREILKPGYVLTDKHRDILKIFWLLQHLRTEAASKRSVEMNEGMRIVIGLDDGSFRLEIREAVQVAMRAFAGSIGIVSDLKICLLRNRTGTPFITSDDPAILTNRWHLESPKTRGHSFGLQSAGNVLLLPLNPQVLCLGYDGDVYSIPHTNGWAEIRHDSDIAAFNQHQFLNCRANVFLQDSAHSELIHKAFVAAMDHRPAARHRINYAVLDRREGEFARYRVVNRQEAGDHEEALVHSAVVHAQPTCWPRQLSRRPKGVVFTNGTGVGYVRRAWTVHDSTEPFRKERAHGT